MVATDVHHVPPLEPILLLLVSIFAGLCGRLVGMIQTLIREKSELNMTFSGLTTAVVYLTKSWVVVIKRFISFAARE